MKGIEHKKEKLSISLEHSLKDKYEYLIRYVQKTTISAKIRSFIIKEIDEAVKSNLEFKEYVDSLDEENGKK